MFLKSELLCHVHVTANVCMVMSQHKIWSTRLQMPNIWLYIKSDHSSFKHTHSQTVANRPKQINTNQVHEPNWILPIKSGWLKIFRYSISFVYQLKKSNAVATEGPFGHNVFSKTQISHVFLVFLYLFPTASEIHHLFVLWFILGHHLLIIPTPNKKTVQIEWVTSKSQAKQ